MENCRVLRKIFPPVKAHSATLPEDRIQGSDEVAGEEETKKKKHRREKIGFRDRKVHF